MKPILQQVLAIALALAGSETLAQESHWMVRVGAVHLDPANDSDPLPGPCRAERIHVDSKTIPEVGISYSFTPQLVAELSLTSPKTHDVRLDCRHIGSFRHRMPTLSAQYHFAPQSALNPYLGIGVNYTHISDVHLLDGAGDLEKGSWGLALQAGLNIRLDDSWSLNVDVKKLHVRSDLFLGGTKAGEMKLDPVLFGVGLGYRY